VISFQLQLQYCTRVLVFGIKRCLTAGKILFDNFTRRQLRVCRSALREGRQNPGVQVPRGGSVVVLEGRRDRWN